MIKIITDLSPYHDNTVAKTVEELQQNGYIVSKIERISRDRIFWGENITHIHYQKG